MKNKSILVAFVLIFMSSCAPGANSPLEDHLTAYNWKITYLKYIGVDETVVFNSYVFNFENMNQIITSRPDSTFQGSWYRSNSSQSSPKVYIDFGPHYQLRMLNYDWQQVSRTDNVIELVDNMSASSTEAATFERLP